MFRVLGVSESTTREARPTRWGAGQIPSVGRRALYPPLIRPSVSEFREGIHDLRTRSHLFSVTLVVVALATLVLAATPMLEQVVAVEQFGVARRSWIVVHIDSSMDANGTLALEQVLLSLDGVDELTATTNRELGLIPDISVPVPDQESHRTLGLDGSVPPDSVADDAASVPGVAEAYIRWAQPPPSDREFFEQILPIVTLFSIGLALILIIRLAFSAARMATHPGDGLLTRWIRHGAVVLVPVVLTVLGATVLAAVLWPPLAGVVVSSLARYLVQSRPIADPGLRLAGFMVVFIIPLTLLAIFAESRGRGKHQA